MLEPGKYNQAEKEFFLVNAWQNRNAFRLTFWPWIQGLAVIFRICTGSRFVCMHMMNISTDLQQCNAILHNYWPYRLVYYCRDLKNALIVHLYYQFIQRLYQHITHFRYAKEQKEYYIGTASVYKLKEKGKKVNLKWEIVTDIVIYVWVRHLKFWKEERRERVLNKRDELMNR